MKVREEFQGRSELDPDQAQMVAELSKYELTAAVDPSFVAGQLAATVYEMTLPPDDRSSGFRGCVYELARQLERELATG